MKAPTTCKSMAGPQSPSLSVSPIERLLPILDRVRQVRADSWAACCPAHDDKSPSLHITETGDGTLLVKCWAGCSAYEVVAAVGLEISDLFPRRHTRQRRQESGGIAPKKLRELRATLRHERSVLFIAQCDLAKGKLSIVDAERAGLAMVRIRAIREVLA